MRAPAAILSAVAGALLLLAQAGAQETTPASLDICLFPASDATGSISGHVVVQGPQDIQVGDLLPELLIVPADTPQPLDFSVVDFLVPIDESGNFSASCLPDGDYFIIAGRNTEYVAPPPESVTLIGGDGEEFSLPALRVTVTGGEAVTGIEIVIKAPEPVVIVDGGLSPPAADLPETGTEGGARDATAGYIAAGMIGLAMVALVGAIVLRRARR